MKDRYRFQKRSANTPTAGLLEHGVPVKRGLGELLIYLKDHNIKTAVATASSESWTLGKCQGSRREKYFDDYIYGDMGRRKQSQTRPIFLLGSPAAGGGSGHALSWKTAFNGIKAAAAGGFNPVMIPDQDQPDEEIRNLLTACCETVLQMSSASLRTAVCH